MATVNPYLNFSGNCEEAFNFYKDIFGGDFWTFQRFSDVPAETATSTEAPVDGDMILHVSLPIGDGVLMGSDRPAYMGPTTTGDNMHINLSPDGEEQGRQIFNSLSEGGQVTVPFEKTFWDAHFGMLVDKFGVQWMVNYVHNPQS